MNSNINSDLFNSLFNGMNGTNNKINTNGLTPINSQNTNPNITSLTDSFSTNNIFNPSGLQSVNPNFSEVKDSSGNTISIGINDKLFIDEKTGQLYLQKGDGQTQNILSNDNLTPTTSDTIASSGGVQKALSDISSSDKIWSALGLPPELYTGLIDMTSMVPNLGDMTGITIQAGIFASASLYTQLQRTVSIINWLNTAPTGTQPNPNFSYLPGRPPFGKDTPEGQKEQSKVFANLRTNIIAQLVRIADQLKAENAGLKQQTDLATNWKKTQDENIKKWGVDSLGGG